MPHASRIRLPCPTPRVPRNLWSLWDRPMVNGWQHLAIRSLWLQIRNGWRARSGPGRLLRQADRAWRTECRTDGC
jgi:hypothetical protein